MTARITYRGVSPSGRMVSSHSKSVRVIVSAQQSYACSLWSSASSIGSNYVHDIDACTAMSEPQIDSHPL